MKLSKDLVGDARIVSKLEDRSITGLGAPVAPSTLRRPVTCSAWEYSKRVDPIGVSGHDLKEENGDRGIVLPVCPPRC